MIILRKLVILLSILAAQFNYTIAMQPDSVLVKNYLDTADMYLRSGDLVPAKAYYQQAVSYIQIDSTNFKSLLGASKVYERLIQSINGLLVKMPNPNHRIIFNQFVNVTYERAIELYYLLYQLTKNDDHFEQAFALAEFRKNTLLINNIRVSTSDQNFAGVPFQVLQEEGNLLARLTAYEDSLAMESAKPVRKNKKIENFERNIDLCNNAYQKWSEQLKLNYPKYYQSKYQAIDNSNVKNLSRALPDKKSAFVEYFYGEQNVYAFVLTHRNYRFIKVGKADQISEHIVNFQNAIQGDYSDFIQTSYKLYRLLIEPFQSLLNSGNKLIVVTDKFLCYIPFEALILSEPVIPDYDYQKLDYLVNHQCISYDFSGFSAMKNIENMTVINDPQMLAFAPVFENEKLRSTGIENLYDVITPLPLSQKMIKTLKHKFSGEYFVGEEAFLSNFTKNVKKFHILHFATHTFIDDESPMNSRIVFAKENSTDSLLAAGYLRLNTIFGLPMNCEMAVLGSCETGSGKYRKGLGIMSMAYGFQFSGVKSLVYSLWKVDETETNKLFDLFYSQIKKGVSKDVALYLAKIEYLKKAGPITANPRYWSGFVVSGNTSPFSFSPNYKLYIVGALAIIVLLILVIRYRKLLIR